MIMRAVTLFGQKILNTAQAAGEMLALFVETL